MVAALVTGVIMRFAPSSWITWATGATLVHDTLFFAITLAVLVQRRVRSVATRPARLDVQRAHLAPMGEAHAGAWLSEVEASEVEASEVEASEVEASENGTGWTAKFLVIEMHRCLPRRGSPRSPGCRAR